ncbi:MAG TPA: hypothetical protein VJ831_03620 [Jatrophihabitantaceae bacterium]|nr:hypothetical protein [Jatrophihabitantaceae bacterium]
MDAPQQVVAAFASFVRQRLAEVGGTLAPLLTRRTDAEVVPARSGNEGAIAGARHVAMMIVGAAAPFATTSHARARLLRQAHASGLLTAREAEQARRALDAPVA